VPARYNGTRSGTDDPVTRDRITFPGVLVAARSTTGQDQRQTSPPVDPDAANHYELLGVRVEATSAEITRAYREAMKRFHPDRVAPEYRPAAESICKDLNRAYDTLSNPVKRVAYDRTIRQDVVQDQIMRRYTGMGGPPPVQQHAPGLKREPTAFERSDHRRSERSAIVSLFAIFVIVTVGAIGLILVAGLLSYVIREVF
jgi:hypothetical protein